MIDEDTNIEDFAINSLLNLIILKALVRTSGQKMIRLVFCQRW